MDRSQWSEEPRGDPGRRAASAKALGQGQRGRGWVGGDMSSGAASLRPLEAMVWSVFFRQRKVKGCSKQEPTCVSKKMRPVRQLGS